MQWWQEFHFLRPYWLIALIIPVLFYYGVVKYRKVISSWADICDENLLEFLLIKSENNKRRTPLILAIFIMIFIILALSGPTWMKKNNPSLSIDNPVMILLNVSSDMWVKDISPSRIVRAKYIVKDLIKQFKSTETGFLVYSREPFIITPLTEDVSLIDNLLPMIDLDIMPENGDRLDRAINLAVDRLNEAGYKKGNIIVLATDVGERFDAALDSANNASKIGFDINIIGINSKNNEKLKMIAEKGSGLYISYNQSLDGLIDKINDVLVNELKQSDNMQTVWIDMGYYFLFLPAFILLYFFRKGVLIILFLLSVTSVAEASWFLNKNQQAMKFFEEKDYGKAEKTFEDKKWKAVSAYRNGDFDVSYDNFSSFNDLVSLYNQGNALAKSGKIEDAIKKYEEVLKQDANFEDARFNLEYLKKQQQNQQNQQNQNSENKNKDSEKQQNSQKQNKDNNNDGQKNKENENDKNQEQNDKNLLDENNSQQSDNSEQKDKKNQQNSNTGEENSDENDMQNSKGDENQKSTDKSKGDEKDNENNVDKQNDENKPNNDGEEQEIKTTVNVKEGKNTPEDQEKIRARLQKFREIPEDKGGLLRAFIKREYDKKRYND